MIKPFVRHDSRVVLTTRIFRVREDTLSHPQTGHTASYFVLENPDWVNVVALTDDAHVVLVRQWRHGIAQPDLELPAGLVEPGEAPEAAAARELMEETGYAPAKVSRLGSTHPNSAYQSNRCYTVLAEGCRPAGATNFDEGEDIELVLKPVAEIPRLVRDGTLSSAMGLVGLLWWLDAQGGITWPGA